MPTPALAVYNDGMKTTVIILAAGQGKRMRSDLPKVLHPLAGRPLLGHVIDGALALKPREIRVVHGHGGSDVQAAFADSPLRWVHQAEQRGTGHAVRLALPGIPARDIVLVLYGDVPLVQPGTLRKLVARAAQGKLAILTARFADPTGYGRIVRGERGMVHEIVEERDATKAQRALTEINTGLLACPAGRLNAWVGKLRATNAQREYYLTDIISMAVKDGYPAVAVAAASADEVMGINDKRQLAEAGAILRQRMAETLMAQGVTVIDPRRIDIRGTLRCGRDVTIDVNAVFEGDVTLGDGVQVGPGAVIRDCAIGAGTRIHAYCVMERSTIGARCEIGPYARVRPEVRLGDGGKLGNFVEIKKSDIGTGSKVNHLSYIGDATIGAQVNVGAGTITCNYDGIRKHRTVIHDGAFIGSGVELVAPVEIGADATIGAGSTITKPAPPAQLTLERARQLTIPHWKRK